MKARSHHPVTRHPVTRRAIARVEALPAPRPLCAPAQLAAYAMGATLWAPALVLVAGQLQTMLAWIVPGLPLVGAARMFEALWVLRFVFYLVGAARGFDYGYGINGVIANRHLTLAEKARRIACDWFGVLLAAVWLCFMVAAMITAIAGR
jgi:hypothetical protein